MSASAEQTVRGIADVAAVGTGVAVFLQWLPAVVGVVTILYTALRIFEFMENRHAQAHWPFGPFPKRGSRVSGQSDSDR